MMISTRDKILSQIPNHIVKNNPRFVDFLCAYYEWCAQEDNAQYAIKKHINRLNMEESLDVYTKTLENEYLHSLPKQDLGDVRELLIKLSKRFNRSRGSRLSYQFLIKSLLGENDLEFYNPKDDIFTLSGSKYINNEYRVVVDYDGVLPDDQLMNDGEAYLDRFNFIEEDQQIEIIYLKPSKEYGIGDILSIGENDFIVTESSAKKEGVYRDTKSHLSNTSVLQDSDYYSVYSFVIRTQQDIQKYKAYIEENLVPAGFKLFIE